MTLLLALWCLMSQDNQLVTRFQHLPDKVEYRYLESLRDRQKWSDIPGDRDMQGTSPRVATSPNSIHNSFHFFFSERSVIVL